MSTSNDLALRAAALGRASWQARLVGLATSKLLRRESWGSEQALARRARRLFGAPRLYSWLRARGVKVQPSTHAHVRGEWITPANASDGVMLFIHGGGFVSCSAATHRPITFQLARLTGFRIFAVDYRLAPEHRYPAALDDVMTAYRYLLRDITEPARLAVAGDSAGGGLTLSLLVRARDEGLPLPACAALLSPWVDLTGSGASVRQNNGRCLMFRPQNVPDFAAAYLGDGSPAEPHASPVFCDLTGLPPLLLQVCATELLLDDAVMTHDRIQSTGGSSELQVFGALFHGWHMLDGIVPEARHALQQVAQFVTTRAATNEA